MDITIGERYFVIVSGIRVLQCKWDILFLSHKANKRSGLHTSIFRTKHRSRHRRFKKKQLNFVDVLFLILFQNPSHRAIMTHARNVRVRCIKNPLFILLVRRGHGRNDIFSHNSVLECFQLGHSYVFKYIYRYISKCVCVYIQLSFFALSITVASGSLRTFARWFPSRIAQ